MSITLEDGDITYGNPSTIAAKVADSQMGITLAFGGINNWTAYLDDQETDNNIDEDDRYEL